MRVKESSGFRCGERRRRRGREARRGATSFSMFFSSRINLSFSRRALDSLKRSPPSKLTALSRQKTEASLVGARSADKSRLCACAPRVKMSEVMAIEQGADNRMPSSAHEESALLLLLLAPAGAPAVTLFMACMKERGAEGKGKTRRAPPRAGFERKSKQRMKGEAERRSSLFFFSYWLIQSLSFSRRVRSPSGRFSRDGRELSRSPQANASWRASRLSKRARLEKKS